MPKSKRKNAKEEDENSAQDTSLPKLPYVRDAAMLGCNIKLRLDKLDDSRKKILTECAILAMQDYALRFEDYRDGLRFIKLLKASFCRVAGYSYGITFLGACNKHGETTYHAGVYDCVVCRKVERVWINTMDQCYTGLLCIPRPGISISMDIASSSNVSPSENLAIGGDEDKIVHDDTNKSSLEAFLKDCAILAMQDHAIQDYCDDLRFIKVVNHVASNSDDGTIYSITFQGASDKYSEATYIADVYDSKSERKVGCVRTISPPKGWYTGQLCIPKFACKLE